MKKILTIAALSVLAMPATAQDDPVKALVNDLTNCAAVAQASAGQAQHILRDNDGAIKMMKVSDAYRWAAVQTAKPATDNPQGVVDALIKEKMPAYAAKLSNPQISASVAFPGLTQLCQQLEPTVAAAIQDIQAGQEKP